MGNVLGIQATDEKTPNHPTHNEAPSLVEKPPPPHQEAYTDDGFRPTDEPETLGFCHQNGCSNGSKCHPSQPGPTDLASTSRPREPCHLYAKGHCKEGDLCRLSHTIPKEGGEEGTVKDSGIPGDDQVREFGGVWAKFGDGASVVSVTLPSDFSAVRLWNLPGDFTRAAAKKLLSNVGLFISEQDVQDINNTAYKSTSSIKVNDPTFAQTACKTLPTLLEAQAYGIAPIPPPIPIGSGSRRVSSRLVSCSWLRPTRTAYLDFETQATAHRVSGSFTSGSCKVNGFQVEVATEVIQVNKNTEPHWRIQLANLVGVTDEQDIVKELAASDKPQRVNMEEPTYASDPAMDSTRVQSLFDGFGPMEKWNLSENPKGRSYEAFATLLHDSDAQDAVSSLNGVSLPFCKENKLILRLVTSVNFTIPRRLLSFVKKRAKLLNAGWRHHHIRCSAFQPPGPNAILMLRCDNRQHLAQAAEEMGKIITGHVMSMEGNDMWHPDLDISHPTYERHRIHKILREIEKDLDVIIFPNSRTSQTRLFGPQEMIVPATEALHHLIQQSTSTTQSLLLHEPGDLEWFKQGGRNILEEEFGPEKVDFDTTTRCLRINGAGEDLAISKRILARRQLRQTANFIQASQLCSDCGIEAKEPQRISCEHVYCTLCFSKMCQAEASSTKEFRIACKGDFDRCARVLPFSEIQNLLLSEVFENILEASFKSYMRLSVDQFRNCPTPGCTQLYRVASADSSIVPRTTCLKCLAVVCTGCFTSHAGWACRHKEDEAFAKAKERLGIQDCPNCKTSIERPAGCNHVECSACGSCMCWLCLAVFDTIGLCYAHMRSSHAGYN
ncbi:hypothetical protein B0I35DRAFT_423738 [Stachybotrys elegans]|uniref:Uncharacterized protein n=1 Tax=Stachybotrys elegans TaxID=80388 RepID=A0A8K0WUN8_9HYPO|nr:hypothetical protein B0I35DRAFT_423738 [Stachybotrys elegans]